ncbi:hypothetical protein SNEBB_004617, partial [Seison nebaliae]
MLGNSFNKLPQINIYKINEQIDNSSYEIKILSPTYNADYCFSCHILKEDMVEKETELIVNQTISMNLLNWLNGTVLDVIFRWHKINRYRYQIQPMHEEKIIYCNVMVDPSWKGETCNHSTKYCTFYCEKHDNKCLPSPIYHSV